MVTKYFAATLVFAAALIGIGEKVVSAQGIALRQISHLQWVAIAVATLSYAVVVFETRRTQNERKDVRELAGKQIKRAIDELLFPFQLILVKLAAINDWNRADDPRYLLGLIADTNVRSGFAQIDVTADSGTVPKRKIWQALERGAKGASHALSDIVPKFSSYLSAKTLTAVETLRSDEMVSSCLPKLGQTIKEQDVVKQPNLEQVLGRPESLDTMLARVGVLLDRIER